MGLIVFSAASALCGLSSTEWWFIVSRGLQGVGGALLLPTTSAILISHFELKERGKALGIYTSIGSIFLILGPLVGGALTQYLSWRYVFWNNLPIAAVGLALALMIIPKSPKKNESFDVVGFLTLSLGILCFGLLR